MKKRQTASDFAVTAACQRDQNPAPAVSTINKISTLTAKSKDELRPILEGCQAGVSAARFAGSDEFAGEDDSNNLRGGLKFGLEMDDSMGLR